MPAAPAPLTACQLASFADPDQDQDPDPDADSYPALLPLAADWASLKAL